MINSPFRPILLTPLSQKPHFSYKDCAATFLTFTAKIISFIPKKLFRTKSGNIFKACFAYPFLDGENLLKMLLLK